MLSHSTGHRSGQALQMTALWDCCRKRSSTRTMESSRRVDLISPSAALPQNERWLNRIANSGELAADRQLALAELACAIRGLRFKTFCGRCPRYWRGAGRAFDGTPGARGGPGGVRGAASCLTVSSFGTCD